VRRRILLEVAGGQGAEGSTLGPEGEEVKREWRKIYYNYG